MKSLISWGLVRSVPDFSFHPANLLRFLITFPTFIEPTRLKEEIVTPVVRFGSELLSLRCVTHSVDAPAIFRPLE